MHLEGVVPAGETHILPDAITEIERILRAAARYLIMHSFVVPHQEFEGIFEGVMATVMNRFFAIVSTYDESQGPSVGSKRLVCVPQIGSQMGANRPSVYLHHIPARYESQEVSSQRCSRRKQR